MNLLLQLLTSKRDAILARWLDRTLEGYAADRTHFLKQEQDRFRNPVGHALRENLPVLLEAPALGQPAGASRSALDAIVRMRAVQDFSPAQAVSFVPLLKDVVREELRICRQIEPNESDYAEFEGRIDELTLPGVRPVRPVPGPNPPDQGQRAATQNLCDRKGQQLMNFLKALLVVFAMIALAAIGMKISRDAPLHRGYSSLYCNRCYFLSG